MTRYERPNKPAIARPIAFEVIANQRGSLVNADDSSVEYWIEQLGGRIDACDACQPCDGGEVVWTEGEPESLREFLVEHGVPEVIQEDVAKELYCSCGNDLQLDSEVVIDSVGSQLDEEAGDRFGWWAVEDNPRFKEFDEHLQRSPNEGRAHDLGREIYEQMKELEPRTIQGDWWRARSLDATKMEPAAADLGPPPGPPVVAGRFNRVGQRVFYLGSDKKSVIREATKYRKEDRRLWLQCFRITGLDKVVELKAPSPPIRAFYDARLPSLFAGLLWCNGLVQQREGEEQAIEYVLSQYIAQCAADLGIRGITFNSLLHSGTNLVLFDWHDTDVIAVGSPERVD